MASTVATLTLMQSNGSDSGSGDNGDRQGLNQTCSFFDEASIWTMGFFASVVIAFGLVANVLNVVIFTHRFMRVSLLNWYYAALSISDLLVLLTGLVRDSLPRIFDYYAEYGGYSVTASMSPVAHALGCVAQTCSVYMTVAMSAHRFIGVCYPFKASRICSRKHTRYFILSVLLFAVLFNITRWFEVTTFEQTCVDNDNLTLVFTETDALPLRSNPAYMRFYLGVAYTVVMYVIPFYMLIGLNARVILAIRNTASLHRRMSVRDTNVTKRREMSKEIQTNVMLIGVVIVFLVCNTPAFVANVLEIFGLQEGSNVFSKVVDFNNLLVLVNASINCFVYLSFSEKYQALLKHYLGCGCCHDSEPLIDASTGQTL